jgi:hypothetical protein
MASDKEQIDICTSFMLTSPPGEFMEVVTGEMRGTQSCG